MQLASDLKSLSRLELVHNNESMSPSEQYLYNNDSVSTPNHAHDNSLPYYFMKRKQNEFPSSPATSKKKQRIVMKDGEYNICRRNISQFHKHYMADLFTTLVDIRWRWNLLIFSTAFVSSWIVFATMWWLISYAHDDLVKVKDANSTRCVIDVYDFTTALLFSIETQHTIGYGGRRITEHCPYAIIVMMIQCVCGVAIQALMTGLVFAKLSRPKKRAETIIFSRRAVIYEREGYPCLVIRVGDIRKSRIFEAHAHAILIRNRGNDLEQSELNLAATANIDDSNRVLLSWPIELVHRIDESSPFYKVTENSLLNERFEIIVYLEGVVECTGMTTQARTSYLPCEISWAERFQPLASYNIAKSQYQIDYSLFHLTTPTNSIGVNQLSSDFLNISKPIINNSDNVGCIQSV